jgi:formylglycine-generating enzyme required for sulfatase activity/serine/threonine protein kinase
VSLGAGDPSVGGPASSLADVLQRAIDGLEHDPGFDLERYLERHPEHAAEVGTRVAKLRRAGMLRRPGTPEDPVELAGATFVSARPIAGRYRVVREIGRGGMGHVLLARDERLEREVAIKVAAQAGDEARARLEREAKILAQLEHPNIVAVHDGGTTEDGRAFCAMRVVGGKTLHEAMGDAEPLGLARKVQIVIAVCDAIAFAHRRGIVHRDLKPSNVMLGEHGEVQVVDWGLAKRVGASDPAAPADPTSFASFTSGVYETVDGYAFGTPSYSAPEQAKGEIADIDERSDVFGLGAILHHVLVGRPPYCGVDREEVLSRAREHRLNDPELAHGPSRVPPDLVAVCKQACAAAKSERYAGARELADDLRAFLEQRTVKAYRTGALAELASFARRNKLGVALAGAVVAIVAVGVIALLESSARREAQFVGDISLLPRLVASADELAPWYPGQVPALEEWIREAQSLAGRIVIHRDRLAEARAALAHGAPSGRVLLSLAEADQADLVAGLEDLLDDEAGLIATMRARADAARTIEERSITGTDARNRWDEAIRSIGDVNECPQYGGLQIASQMGLLPIGRDPSSGLWEFAALLTGDEPERKADGALDLREKSAVVLVLIPGGTFRMGAQSKHPNGEHYDPNARENEDPVKDVTLAPYFISKYELTQGQWERLARSNPSFYAAGGTYDMKQFTRLHPVETVSWDECVKYLRLAGLSLPTEAQWEYAARAGTSSVNWTGDDESSIEGAANIADQACKRIYPSPDGQFAALDDGWALHAPVDFGRPNSFGLHGVIGNVCEWCRDAYASYEVEPAPIDGDRSAEPWNGDEYVKVNRDCSYYHSGSYVRVAHRFQAPSNARDLTLGVRPARALDP